MFHSSYRLIVFNWKTVFFSADSGMCVHANITEADKRLSSARKIETHLGWWVGWAVATLATVQVKDTRTKCYFLLTTLFHWEFPDYKIFHHQYWLFKLWLFLRNIETWNAETNKRTNVSFRTSNKPGNYTQEFQTFSQSLTLLCTKKLHDTPHRDVKSLLQSRQLCNTWASLLPGCKNSTRKQALPMKNCCWSSSSTRSNTTVIKEVFILFTTSRRCKLLQCDWGPRKTARKKTSPSCSSNQSTRWGR